MLTNPHALDRLLLTVEAWLTVHAGAIMASAGLVLLTVGLARLGWQKVRATSRNRLGARSSLTAKLAPVIEARTTSAGIAGRPLTIQYPKHPDRPGAVLIIKYPDTFQALDAQTAVIREIVTHALPGEWEMHCDYAAHELRFVPKPPEPVQPPPPVLPTSLAYVDDPAGRVDLVPFAVSTGGWLNAELTELTPMVLISAATGWGKSSTARIFVAHIAGHGGLVDIVDPKRISLAEFRGCPCVRYWVEVEDFTRVVEDYRKEIEDRYRAKEAGADLLDRQRWPLRLLVLEEAGTLMAMVTQHWQETKPRGGPAQPPTISNLMRILWMGRAAGMHVLTAAQQANAKVLVSSDSRDQYALRILAGPTSTNSWAMMYGDEPMLASEPLKGRAIVGIGPDLARVQLARLDPAPAREMALRGTARFLPVEPPVEVTSPPDQRDALLNRSVADTPPPPATTTAKGGRPPDVLREPVAMTCKHCDHHWTTRAASGNVSACPKCRKSRQVPKRTGETVAPPTGAEWPDPVQLVCADCEHTWPTRAAGGSTSTCTRCGKSTRVPGRTDAEQAAIVERDRAANAKNRAGEVRANRG